MSNTSASSTDTGLSLRITVTEQGLFLGEGDGITVGPAGFHDALAGILSHWRTAELGPPPNELPPGEDSVSVLLTTTNGTIETTLRTKAAGGQILSRGHVGTDEQTETWLHQCEGWLARALAGYACEDEPIDLSMEDSDPEYESRLGQALIAAIQKDPSIASRLWAGPPLDLSDLEVQ